MHTPTHTCMHAYNGSSSDDTAEYSKEVPAKCITVASNITTLCCSYDITEHVPTWLQRYFLCKPWPPVL